MFPFQKNFQRFLVFFFTAISIIIVVMGVARAKKSANFTATEGDQVAPPIAMPTNTAGALSFSGASYQTPWGNASAAIQIKDGRVVAVTMPQVPNSPPSQYAEPYLVQQALALGTANIHGVSGATYTSIAFKSSLENALAKAKTGGQTIIGGTNTSASATAKPTVPRMYRGDDDEWED